MQEPTVSSNVKETSGMRAQSDQDIGEFMDEFEAAVRTGKLEDIAKFYADDLVVYDMTPPLQYKSKEQFLKVTWKESFLDIFAFPVEYSIQQRMIEVRGDLALVSGLAHLKASPKAEGESVDGWLRLTSGLKQVHGKWAIYHEHTSVPVDLESGKAIMDLTPDAKFH